MNTPSLICFPAMVMSLALVGGGASALAGPAGKPATGAAIRPAHANQTLPVASLPAFRQAIAQDAGAAYAINRQGCAALPKQTLTACFDTKGAHFTGAARLALRLTSYGWGNDLASVTSVRPDISRNQVSYGHGNLTERWRVLPVGFEQVFTITKRPAGNGELVLALSTSRQEAGAPYSRAGGNPVGTSPSIPLRSEEGKGIAGFRVPLRDTGLAEKAGELGWGQLRYGQLVVTDATGKVVPATLNGTGNRILIAVNDARAVYPLTVDPLVWVEQKVTTGDEFMHFGGSVAVSGTTAFVGADRFGENLPGTVYVFKQADGTWTQVQKLTESGGNVVDGFGDSVALDGPIAVIGAPGLTVNGNPNQGAVYVFSESNDTWTQAAELTASDGAAEDSFGSSVALSGTTALVTGGHKVYVFRKSRSGSWIQTDKLTHPDGSFVVGWVAVSGTTALVGNEHTTINGNQAQGAAWVFTEADNGLWTQTAELTASDGAAGDLFGISVALDGTTALVGADQEAARGRSPDGAAYVFSESGGTWTQTQKLTASDGKPLDAFGYAVALDGRTALIGAWLATVNGRIHQGAAYVFGKSGGTWTQVQKLTASDGDKSDTYGSAVAISGNTALVGAPRANVTGNFQHGAAYFYGGSDLGLLVSVPGTVYQGLNYIAQTYVTNSSSTTSAAVTATMAVPAAASFISATATQGSCSETAGVVTCNFGAIDGDAGLAFADVGLKAIGDSGTEFKSTATLTHSTPPLTASAATTIIPPLETPPPDGAPIAEDGTLGVDENSSATGTLQAHDPDGDALTFRIVAEPRHGRLNLADASKGAYTYTPDPDYVGNDSFTFKASDGQLESNTAKTSITVNRVCQGCNAAGGSGGLGWPPLLALLGLACAAAWTKQRRSRIKVSH